MKNRYAYIKENREAAWDAFERLNEIIKILRAECPWDRVQTHETLITPMIEEAYEAVNAIKKKDFENLKEELGDVLLQVVFHGILAEEDKKFTLSDVVNEECEKMIRRHPHVFEEEYSTDLAENGNFSTKSVDKVLEKWENIKRKEHLNVSYCEALENVPISLPALMRSQKVQKKASSVGFDWERVDDAFLKIEEESLELKEAYSLGAQEDIEEELGDLLFSVVNVARFLKVDSERALTKATDKFIDRFRTVEGLAESEGANLKDMSLTELDRLWHLAKVQGK